MKIITKDNFCRDLFTETVIAENVNRHFGEQLVKAWNDRYWNEHSDYYLELVEDNYRLYDGYADLA
jgi:hypothetical protein